MTISTIATDRIDIRLVSEDKGIIQQAASYEGISVAAFIRKAALEVARSIIDRNERIRLSQEDGRRIMAALNRPFEPNEALRKALLLAEEVEKNSPEFS